MKSLTAFAMAAVVAGVVWSAPVPAAQRGRGAAAPAAPAGPAPRMANGKPDLSGHWANP